jgi:hypothetical protein
VVEHNRIRLQDKYNTEEELESQPQLKRDLLLTLQDVYNISKSRLGSTQGDVGVLLAIADCPEANGPALDGNEDEQAAVASGSTLGWIDEEQAAVLESEGGKV